MAGTVTGTAEGLPRRVVPRDSLLPGPEEPAPGRHLQLAGAPGAGAPHSPCMALPRPDSTAAKLGLLALHLPPWALVFVVPVVLSQGRPLGPVRAVAQDAASAPKGRVSLAWSACRHPSGLQDPEQPEPPRRLRSRPVVHLSCFVPEHSAGSGRGAGSPRGPSWGGLQVAVGNQSMVASAPGGPTCPQTPGGASLAALGQGRNSAPPVPSTDRVPGARICPALLFFPCKANPAVSSKCLFVDLLFSLVLTCH